MQQMRRCGSVKRCFVSTAFRRCALELYLGWKVGWLSEEHGSKLTSVQSG